ncbi:S1C family serine protease [Gorillibacterium timonense]|uniref:S1C family serine protease n=1 Tax=Gorillibacterium timonense TaxID=1689269 RepID=UPI00071D2F1C|nr:trypsin-like peptidase domain-containing protein [Gorillibacterium timonense]
MEDNNKRDFDDFFKDNTKRDSETERMSDPSEPTESKRISEPTEYTESERRSIYEGETAASQSPEANRADSVPPTEGGDSAESEKPSYYYSYGPYKSQENEPIHSASQEDVEVTPPRLVRPLDVTPRPQYQWSSSQPPKKKRSRFMATMSTILATVLVTGGLMFGADKYNLFTSGESTAASGNASTAAATVSTATGSGKNVVDLVRPDNIPTIVQNSSPAVVKIVTLVKPTTRGSSSSSLFDDPLFRQFFGDGNESNNSNNSQNQSNQEPQVSGYGSGFIFEKSGYILTNQHVISGADEVQVYVEGTEEPYTAELLGNSTDLDLAVLKIKGTKDFPTLPLAANVDSVNVGDWVVAIGNPYGMDHTVTVGVLSAKERSIEIQDGNTVRKYKHLMQTDASINPGNSGGPLLNLNGEVIGINTAINAEAQGIGYVVPISTINEVVDKLKNGVEIPKEPVPYVGVKLSDIPQSYVKDLGLSNTNGAFVQEVVMGSPAFKAGIKTYDVIVSVNGKEIKSSEVLVNTVQSLKVGDNAVFGVIRDGKKSEITVTIGDSTKVTTNTTNSNN